MNKRIAIEFEYAFYGNVRMIARQLPTKADGLMEEMKSGEGGPVGCTSNHVIPQGHATHHITPRCQIFTDVSKSCYSDCSLAHSRDVCRYILIKRKT